MRIGYLAFGLILTTQVYAQDFSAVRNLITQGYTVKAFQSLHNSSVQDLNATDQQLHAFTMAFLSQELGHFSEVHTWLAKDKNSLRKEYRHFLSGRAFYKLGHYQRAVTEFEKILSLNPAKNILYETHFKLSKIAMERKQWKLAYKHLNLIEKKWRTTHRHPQVVWDLIKVHIKRQKDPCPWARKMYAKYPAHSLVYDWSIQLEKARYEGQKLGCRARIKDQDERVRRFQWSGESERARQEIENLRHHLPPQDAYKIDRMLVNFLINEGYVDEAMKILTGYYKQKNKDFEYLMLLGRAASKAGEYQTAVKAYYQAYQNRSKSSRGHEALFNAAFLSYQFQDYDGASKKFEELIKKSRVSKLKRDAQYHLAWIRYLKGHYWNAIQKFDTILRYKNHHHRLWNRYPKEKIQYWLAMSHKRLKNNEKAHQLFRGLQEDQNNNGFYSIAADYRVRSISEPLYHSRHLDLVSNDSESLYFNQFNKNIKPDPTKTSGNKFKLYEEFIQNKNKTLTNTNAIDKGLSTKESSYMSVTFENPKLRKRFSRAKGFIRVGLWEWAQWELYEIERKTKSKADLKQLIKYYEDIGFFNRSAYISTIYFSNERNQIHTKNHSLWISAYPKAYKKAVLAAAQEFQVSPEFIWSIMRAETFFKPQAISPVGARGLMQLMPHTARKVASLMGDSPAFRESELFEPEVNIRLGTRYLKRLLKKFKGSIPLAAAAYNAGPHRVEDWLSKFGNLDMDEFIEHIPFRETKKYVKKVINNFNIYQTIYSEKSSQTSLAWLSQPIAIKIKGRPATRETWEPLSQ